VQRAPNCLAQTVCVWKSADCLWKSAHFCTHKCRLGARNAHHARLACQLAPPTCTLGPRLCVLASWRPSELAFSVRQLLILQISFPSHLRALFSPFSSHTSPPQTSTSSFASHSPPATGCGSPLVPLLRRLFVLAELFFTTFGDISFAVPFEQFEAVTLQPTGVWFLPRACHRELASESFPLRAC